MIPAGIEASFRKLRASAKKLRQLEAADKNRALNALADRVVGESTRLLNENAEDLKNLAADTTSAFRDRLTLTAERISHMAESLRQVAKQADPVGELVEEKILPNGLKLRKVRAPLGVIFMIFESRPNVILEAFSLAFKSGNAIALRGGSDSRHTAKLMYQIMREALNEAGVDPGSFYGFDNYDRPLVEALLKRQDLIDITVPRGGERLIDFVSQTATMPIIKNDRGLCHAFVDREADITMAVEVVRNAKTSRPGVCNSLETVLVDEKVANEFLPRLYQACTSAKLKWLCDEASKTILIKVGPVELAKATDWDTEHLDQILNCRIVSGLKEALDHIEAHGSKHSEVIITKNEKTARHFQAEVDAAAVYWNASTRFTDGFEFGLGGELGISTQKLHVRGPVGLRELTTPRWIIDGSGQIRN